MMTIYINSKINNNNKVYEDEKENKCKLLLYQREIRNCRKNKLIKLSRFNIYYYYYLYKS